MKKAELIEKAHNLKIEFPEQYKYNELMSLVARTEKEIAIEQQQVKERYENELQEKSPDIIPDEPKEVIIEMPDAVKAAINYINDEAKFKDEIIESLTEIDRGLDAINNRISTQRIIIIAVVVFCIGTIVFVIIKTKK